MSALTDSTYFIGQGSVAWAPRITSGALSGGFTPFGDVQMFGIDQSKQKIVEVEENTTGFGGTALYASVAIPLAIKLQLTQWNMASLALASYGANSGPNVGGTVTGEAINGYVGLSSFLQNIGASAVTLSTVAGSVSAVTVGTPGTTYTTAPTVAFAAPPAGGVQATGYAVLSGATVGSVKITNPGSGYTVAPAITFTGGGGSGAAATASIAVAALVANTDFTFGSQFGSISILSTSPNFGAVLPANAIPLTAAYTYGANNGSVGALLTQPPEIALMYSGLNVANPSGGSFGAVKVYVNRVRLNVSKMLDLLSKKEGVLELDGACLYDGTVGTGVSPYYTITKA